MNDVYVSVEPNCAWISGFISSEDTQCWVDCICGERPSISETPTYCKCGRIYWTEFRAYQMETKEQHEETFKMNQGNRYE